MDCKVGLAMSPAPGSVSGIRTRTVSTIAALVASATLVALIYAGSRGFRDFDSALIGYAVATVFALGAAVHRYAGWVSRPATWRYFRGGWSSFLSWRNFRRHARLVPEALWRDIFAQGFIARRSWLRWSMHMAISWGVVLSCLTQERIQDLHLTADLLISGALQLVLSTTPRDWVEGILLGELRGGGPELREELAAAALRFVRSGPRHGRDDVCDTSHCSVFAGRGPLVAWPTPRRAVVAPGDDRAAPPLLDDEAWARVLALAARPGPAAFTGHCGGAPLSPFEVWGRGSREATPCPRHGPSDDDAWERLLPSPALDATFGRVSGLVAVVVDGVRRTRVTTREKSVDLLYDDLHRALAPALGWDALPSPPDSFSRDSGGWRARGRGRGHRVGLCLASPSR